MKIPLSLTDPSKYYMPPPSQVELKKIPDIGETQLHHV